MSPIFNDLPALLTRAKRRVPTRGRILVGTARNSALYPSYAPVLAIATTCIAMPRSEAGAWPTAGQIRGISNSVGNRMLSTKRVARNRDARRNVMAHMTDAKSQSSDEVAVI
jgi:hypothetical protein